MAVRDKQRRAKVERGRISGDGKAARLGLAALSIALGVLLCAASVETVLNSSESASSLMSTGLWTRTVESLGGRVTRAKDSQEKIQAEADLEFLPVLCVVGLFCAAWWMVGAWWISRRQGVPFAESAARWGTLGGIWWIIGGSWQIAWIAAFLTGVESLEAAVIFGPAFWIALGAAGWLATFLMLARPAARTAVAKTEGATKVLRDDFRVPPAVWLGYGLYVAVFVVMNWQLYRSLRIPHGDSAMYEEHLWNLLHGKGFRSYLDQGLFLGEHIQVIHLLLLPLYALWPSQMLLELCDSLILAAGCFPVYWMARRHTGSARAATWLAAAYLLYFPMQFLDISIDFKTFRPNGLAIPVLLFALDQLERRRYKTFCGLLLLTLSAQEDYAIVLAPLGVWIALCQRRAVGNAAVVSADPATDSAADRSADRAAKWRLALFGASLAAVSVAYLLIATRLVIPWFRNWQEIHYARYFARFGNSLTEIGWNILTRPRLLFDELATADSALYLLAILLPLGFLSLFSPGRLAVGIPLLVTLLLNELNGAIDPRHHFHAPLVPIIFWSASAGMGAASRIGGDLARRFLLRFGPGPRQVLAERRTTAGPSSTAAAWWGRFACLCALFTGAFFGLSPLSVAFWDADSTAYWKLNYVPGARAELFPRVLAMIPPSTRVASTDFIHPRFTHFARSYDYSDYPRAVNNYKPGVPDDTDYIVIDTHGRYSRIDRPEQVREYREHPDQWELVPDATDGYFIVLKRKRPPHAAAPAPSRAE